MNVKTFSDSEMLSALRDADGFIALAATELGVTYNAINWRLKQKAELAEQLMQIREQARQSRVRAGETVIDNLLTTNHFGAADLVLSRLGRDRGWAPEKQGSNSSVTISFEVNHIIPEAADPSFICSPIIGELESGESQDSQAVDTQEDDSNE